MFLLVPLLVMPLKPNVTGTNTTLTEGREHMLVCVASHANPAASITWTIKIGNKMEYLSDTKEQSHAFNGYYRYV